MTITSRAVGLILGKPCIGRAIFRQRVTSPASNLCGSMSPSKSKANYSTEPVASVLVPRKTVIGEPEFHKRTVKDIVKSASPDEHVQIQGWVKSFRKMKELIFFDISDGLSEHRIGVVSPAVTTPKGLNMHTSVDVKGVLRRNPSNLMVLEVHPTEIKLIGACDQKVYPFGGKIRYTPDHTRQYIHLRPKTNKFSSLLRLRSGLAQAINEYFVSNEFYQVHVPILTSNDCEGAGEIFTVKPASAELIKEMKKSGTSETSPVISSSEDEVFFDKKVHLSVSGQLHLESIASGLEKVWTLSPVFRADNQRSTRHLSEFYMVEAEMAFAYKLDQILESIEGLVKHCVKSVLTNCIGDWSLQIKDTELDLTTILGNIVAHPFVIMTFEEASKLLKERASCIVEPGKGLSREQELILVERLNDNRPVFVIDWPANIKPFYMRECTYDSEKVAAVDLLVPTVGELCGGSLREASVDKLTSRINAMDSSGNLLESLSWYIDLRKYGGTPTGGFGMGFDRLMQLVTGIGNIKDVTPFPRWAHHCPM